MVVYNICFYHSFSCFQSIFQKEQMQKQMDIKIQFVEEKNQLRDELDDLIDEHDNLLEEYSGLGSITSSRLNN